MPLNQKHSGIRSGALEARRVRSLPSFDRFPGTGLHAAPLRREPFVHHSSPQNSAGYELSPNSRLERTFQPRESAVLQCYCVLARLEGRSTWC